MKDDGLFEQARAAAKRVKQDSQGDISGRSEPPPEELVAAAGVSFPVEVLPDVVRKWAMAESMGRQVPVEMPATFAIMAMMSAAIQCDVQIGPGWREPCVSQMMLVAAPSQRKSPSYKRAFAPVREQHKREQRRVEAMETGWRVRMKELETAYSLTLKNPESPEAKEHADIAERIEKIRQPKRRLAADVTPEEFMRLMWDNDQTMVLSSDEGDVFSNFGGRYAQEQAKLSPLLNGWDCGYLPYDRVGQAGKRVHIVLDAPRAGIAVAGQHKVLADLLENPVYHRKGLLARMLYVVLPERTELEDLFPQPMDEALQQRYEDLIRRLFERQDRGNDSLKLHGCRDQRNGWMQPDWLVELRQRCNRGIIGDGEFQDHPEWAGKLVSNMARIAAVLEVAGGGGARHLSRLADFFISHAKLALAGSKLGPQRGTENEELAYLVTRLVDSARKLPRKADAPASAAARTFKVRDIRHSAKRYKSNAAMLPFVEQLVERGFLAELDSSRNVGNRQQARVFQLREDLTLDPSKGGWDPKRKDNGDVPF